MNAFSTQRSAMIDVPTRPTPLIGDVAFGDRSTLGYFSVQAASSKEPTYFLVVPLILLIGYLVGELYPTISCLGGVALLGSLVSFYAGAGLLFRKTSVSFSKLMAVSTLAGYSVTTLYTWYSTINDGTDLTVEIGRSAPILCRAAATVLFVSAVLFVIGELVDRPLLIDLRAISDRQSTKWILLVGFPIVLLAFFHGDLSYMGQQNEGGHITVLGSFGAWIFPALCSLTLMQARCQTLSRLRRTFWWSLFSLQVLLLAPLGRRTFLYTLAVAMFASRFDSQPARMSAFKKGLLAAFLVGLMYITSIAFLYIRFATYEFSEAVTKPTLTELVKEAVRLHDTTPYATVAAALKDNVQERGFVLGFLADVLDLTQRFEPALGQNFTNSITLVIPSVVWPEKLSHLGLDEEGLANQLFGTDYVDESNSLLTNGIVDFGFFGAFLYPAVTALLLTLVLAVLSRRVDPVICSIVCFGAFLQVFSVENVMAGYMAFMRDSLLFVIAIEFIKRLRPDWNNMNRRAVRLGSGGTQATRP